MARTGRVNHTHQYYRHIDGLWHCSGIEGCSHYMPRNLPTPYGRKSLCWVCEKEFLLTPANTEIDKPMCDVCTEQQVTIQAYLEEKMGPDMDPIERALRTAREKNKRKHIEEEEDKPTSEGPED